MRDLIVNIFYMHFIYQKCTTYAKFSLSVRRGIFKFFQKIIPDDRSYVDNRFRILNIRSLEIKTKKLKCTKRSFLFDRYSKLKRKYQLLLLSMVMGSDAIPHEFPWIVRIEINDGSDGNFCGGSIIDQKLVLTGNGKNDHFFKSFMSLFKNVPFFEFPHHITELEIKSETLLG